MTATQELLPGTEVQARGCDALLLLTATPHDGIVRTRAFRARRYNDVLYFIALLKRSVSTVAA